MTNIFVSYSRKDSIAARKLIEEFKSIKLDVWVDWEDIPPAVGWLEQVLEGIEGSDVFIFLMSPDSTASEVCKVEVEHAKKNHKRIIPILVRDVDPKTAIPTIRELNWIFLREQDDFKVGLEKLQVAITLDIAWVEEHRRLQVRALEWERKKDPSLLLRGSDLRNVRKMLASAEKNDPKPTPLQRTYVDFSNRDERRRTTFWISTVVALLIMVTLSVTAVYQSRKAAENEREAVKQSLLAVKNANRAKENERLAIVAQAAAEANEVIAKAQRSVARAQIYQTKTGGLYTSTLLAIDSWLRNPSFEAEEILRKNISLLPIPVAQLKQEALINALEFSPDGDVFVSASADHTACVWKLQGGQLQFCVTSPGSVEDAVFSPDGKLIVTADDTGKVLFIDSKTGKVVDEQNYQVPVWDVNISPDGKALAIARDDGRITFIDLSTREFDYELLAYGSLYVTAFSPNGEWMAAGSTTGSIILWNLADGRIISGPSHRGEVYEIAFSPDGGKLISGGSDNIAYVIQTQTGRELFKITNEDWVEDVVFSPDGSWFVTVSDDARVRVWDTRTGEERLRMLQDSFVSEVKISPNGQWIATTGYDRTVRVWNAATGAEMFQVPLDDYGNILAFSKDGNYLISGDQGGTINILNISVLPASKGYLQFVDAYAEKVAFSPSGEWLVASDLTDVWLLRTGGLSTANRVVLDTPLLSFDSSIVELVVSPDSSWIGVSTDGGQVVLYNINSRTRRILEQSIPGAKIAFSSDSQFLITGNREGIVQTWNVSTGKPGVDLFAGNAQVNSLALYEDQLAMGFMDKVVIVNVTTGQIVSIIEAPGDHHLMAFSPNGSLLAANNSSGQIYIWKLEEDNYSLLYNLPSEQAFSLTFNPLGSQLLVGVPGNVYILSPLTGVEMARIRHKDSVNGLSFSADGNTLATASLRAIQFWDVQKIPEVQGDSLINAACLRLTQNFTPSQWASFFDDEPYRKLCEKLPVP